MHACMHAFIHSFIHSYIQPYIHTYIHTYIHYITLHYITLRYVTLRYVTLHYITLHTYIHIYIYTYICILDIDIDIDIECPNFWMFFLSVTKIRPINWCPSPWLLAPMKILSASSPLLRPSLYWPSCNCSRARNSNSNASWCSRSVSVLRDITYYPLVN